MKSNWFNHRHAFNERGVIMLEGMIVMIITLFLLVWILGVGFVYYQRYTVRIVTNDVAVKIASTYNNPSSDIIMGYVTTEDLRNRDLYRNFNGGELLEINQERAEAYVRYILDKTNFNGVVEDVEVQLDLVQDSMLRRHVEVTTTCKFNTPFGEGLEYFGMDSVRTYRASASADATDVADYISMVNFSLTLANGTYTKGTGFTDSIVTLINTLIKVFSE